MSHTEPIHTREIREMAILHASKQRHNIQKGSILYNTTRWSLRNQIKKKWNAKMSVICFKIIHHRTEMKQDRAMAVTGVLWWLQGGSPKCFLCFSVFQIIQRKTLGEGTRYQSRWREISYFRERILWLYYSVFNSTANKHLSLSVN